MPQHIILLAWKLDNVDNHAMRGCRIREKTHFTYEFVVDAPKHILRRKDALAAIAPFYERVKNAAAKPDSRWRALHRVQTRAEDPLFGSLFQGHWRNATISVDGKELTGATDLAGDTKIDNLLIKQVGNTVGDLVCVVLEDESHRLLRWDERGGEYREFTFFDGRTESARLAKELVKRSATFPELTRRGRCVTARLFVDRKCYLVEVWFIANMMDPELAGIRIYECAVMGEPDPVSM